MAFARGRTGAPEQMPIVGRASPLPIMARRPRIPCRADWLPELGVAVSVYLRFIIQPMNAPASRPNANVAAMASMG